MDDLESRDNRKFSFSDFAGKKREEKDDDGPTPDQVPDATASPDAESGGDDSVTTVDIQLMDLNGYALFLRNATTSTRTAIIDKRPGLHVGVADWAVTTLSQSALSGCATDFWTFEFVLSGCPECCWTFRSSRRCCR